MTATSNLQERATASVYHPGSPLPVLASRCFKTSIVFLLIGVLAGLHMSITHDHAAHPAHAHINLLGWVTLALFGAYYAFHPAKAASKLAGIQFAIYVVGCVVLFPSLYMLVTGNASIEPVVAAGSMITFLGVILFAVIVFRED